MDDRNARTKLVGMHESVTREEGIQRSVLTSFIRTQEMFVANQ